MAFCTNCGRKLIPGQKCICQQTTDEQNNIQQAMNNQVENQQTVAGQQAPEQQVYQQTVNGQQAPGQQVYQQTFVNQAVNHQIQSNNIKEYFKAFCDILSNPKTFGRKLVQEANIVKAFIFICIQAILSGIFIAMQFGKVNNTLEAMLVSSSNTNAVAQFNSFKFPIAKDFFVTVIASIVLSCILALVVYGIVTVLKGKTSFAKSINAVAVRCIGKTPIILIAIVISLFSDFISTITFILSAIIGICYYCMVVTEDTGISEDKSSIIVFLTCIVYIICSYIFIRYCGKFYFSSTLLSTYNDIMKEISEGMKEIGSISEIISNLIR